MRFNHVVLYAKDISIKMAKENEYKNAYHQLTLCTFKLKTIHENTCIVVLKTKNNKMNYSLLRRIENEINFKKIERELKQHFNLLFIKDD